ncbi:MAG TPA: adenylate/guanylate cyclase domain-containing protein [Actinomycetota bacterium]
MQLCPSCSADNPEHARFCLACGHAIDATEPAESRRQVTVLFTDLAGSTDLTHRLDPESLHRVIGGYFDAARTAVGRHGGHIEKFIGDAVMAVFGFPRANEDDALRAVRAAWDLRSLIDEANDDLRSKWDVELAIRTGIATGNVVASDRSTGEPFVIGTSVNLAARLEQHAGTHEILLDGVTRRIARKAIETEEVLLDELRGFDGPVKAHRLLKVLETGEGLPRPEPPFVNRTAELRLLHETYESHVASSRCRTLTLIGSAGLGKSRLVAEFLREHPQAVVLRSRCPVYGEGSALQPLRDVVAQAAGSGPEDDPVSIVEKIRDLLVEQPEGSLAADGIARALGLAPGTTTQEETVWSIRICFETLARRGPLVLAFDDVQWAAPALLDVLEHLAEWARGAPILLLCMARPDLLDLLPTWGRTPGAVMLRLEPLGAAPSRELARHLLASTAAPVFEDTIADVADGNPFFLEEIVTMLEEEGAITPDATPGDLSRIAIPPTISALLAARIDRLDPAARQVLERAAVLGLAFARAHLEALLDGEDAIDVDATLRELAQRDFVVADAEMPGDAYRFRHALTREAAYEAIPKSLRVRLHTAAAERLAREPAGEARDEQVGYHLEKAHHAVRDLSETDPRAQPLAERAGTHLAAAGRAAAGRGDVRAAAGLLERAAELLPEMHAERAGVLMDLHEALLFAGEIERSQGPVAEVLASLAPDDDSVIGERARLQQTMLRFLLDPGATPADVLRGDLERSVRRFEDAGDEASLAAALADLATIHWFEGDAEAMLEAAQLALAHARASGSRRSAAEAAPLIAYALHKGRVPLDEALERLDETRAQLDDDLLARTLLLLDEAMMLAAVGRQGDAKVATDRARDTFEDLGQRRWLEISKAAHAEIARREGKLERAEELLRSVYDFFRAQGDENNSLQIAFDLADVLCDLGQFDEADLLATLVAREGPPDDIEVQVSWRAVRSRTSVARGDPTGAVTLAEEAVSIADTTSFVLLQAEAARALGEALHGAGRTAEAAAALGVALERYESKRAAVPAAEVRERLRTILLPPRPAPPAPRPPSR